MSARVGVELATMLRCAMTKTRETKGPAVERPRWGAMGTRRLFGVEDVKDGSSNDGVKAHPAVLSAAKVDP